MLDRKQQAQETMYEFPYHYIPTWDQGRFSLVRYWGLSGLRYMGRVHFVLDQLKKIKFHSLIDVGCGDGRLLREVVKQYPTADLLGIDYSEQAIQLANALNPALNYQTTDILRDALPHRFEVATLIEVLEHIPPTQANQFLNGIAEALQQDGWLILTVPHANTQLAKRHYRHFTSDQLRNTLEPYFQKVSIISLDPKSKVMTLLYRLLGGKGKHFIINNQGLLTWYYRIYITHFLYTNNEKKCQRLAAVCQKGCLDHALRSLHQPEFIIER